MTPFFSPPPNPYANRPIYLAASGPEMTAVGGEAADGLLLHALTSVATLTEVTLPALQRGLEVGGRSRPDVELFAPVFVVTGDTDEEPAGADQASAARSPSTPRRRPTPSVHGRPDLPGPLNALSKQGRWRDMGALIDDEVLALFGVTGKPAKRLVRPSWLASAASLIA